MRRVPFQAPSASPESAAQPPQHEPDRERRRRRFLEAALLAQPARAAPEFRPYAGSGFSRAVRALEDATRESAA